MEYQSIKCTNCNYLIQGESLAKLQQSGHIVCDNCGTSLILRENKIFLSGTSEFRYLIEGLNDLLYSIGYEPIWFKEKFYLETNDAIGECFTNIEKSDKFIIVIGKNYGYMRNGKKISVIEEEFDYAFSLNKPMMVFIDSEVFNETKFYQQVKDKDLDFNDFEAFTADENIYQFILKIEAIRPKLWMESFTSRKDIVSKITNHWPLRIGKDGIIKKPLKSNYESIMVPVETEPKYFRLLEHSRVSGDIYEVDIKKGAVERIESVIWDLKEELLKNGNWVLLSGKSGLSKTTTAKILAYDVFKSGIDVYFKNRPEEIKDFIKSLDDTTGIKLIIIDDLHRRSFGEISSKIGNLYPLIKFKNLNVIVLAISRLTLKQISDICKNVEERRVIDRFTQINMEDYMESIKSAQENLITNILTQENKFKEDLGDFTNKLIENYGNDFVSLGFALLQLVKSGTPKVDEHIIIEERQEFLKNELEEILRGDALNLQVLISVYIGACYCGLVDEAVSVDHFDQKIHPKKLIWTALNALSNQGLLSKAVVFEKNKNLYQFEAYHAKIAEMDIKALKAGFWVNNDTYEWDDVCTLIRFKVDGLHELDINDVFSNIKTLKYLILLNVGVQSLPDSIKNLKSLEKLDLRYNKIFVLPDTIGELKTLEILNLKNNQLRVLPESINELKLLKKLDISNNPLQKLPETIFGLANIEELRLEHINLVNLSEKINQLKNLIILDLRSNSLKELPSTIGALQFLEELYLDGNKLKALPGSIEELKELKVLSLNSNELVNIPEHIGHLHHLKTLNLSNNVLEELPDSMGKLKSLKMLNLDANNLKILPNSLGNLVQLNELNLGFNKLNAFYDSIGSLYSLRRLLAQNNNINQIPESIGNLKILQELALHFNRLTSVPNSLGSLTSLKKLDIGGNNIKEIPNTIGNLKNLEELYLGYVQIKTFPHSFGNLKKLKIFQIVGSPLNKLPDCLFELESLKLLRMSMCNIEFLPDSIRKLKNLEKLVLNGNKLEKLPDSFGELKFLKEITLDNNLLNILPESIGKLKLLRKLILKNNQITSILSEIRDLSSLQLLDLSNNKLEKLPETIFELNLLKEFDISNNEIKYIPSSIENLKNINEIDISGNQIFELPESIGNLTSLIKLNLSKNQFTTLPYSIGNLQNLKFINLRDNNFGIDKDSKITELLNNLKEKGCIVIR